MTGQPTSTSSSKRRCSPTTSGDPPGRHKSKWNQSSPMTSSALPLLRSMVARQPSARSTRTGSSSQSSVYSQTQPTMRAASATIHGAQEAAQRAFGVVMGHQPSQLSSSSATPVAAAMQPLLHSSTSPRRLWIFLSKWTLSLLQGGIETRPGYVKLYDVSSFER